MKKIISTDAGVRQAGPGRHKIADATGLYLYVSRKGVRRWIWRYVHPGKHKPNETGLGMYPVVTLAAARAEVLKLSLMVRNGVDPVLNKRSQRVASTTFAEAAEEWLRVKQGKWRDGLGGSSAQHARCLLFGHGKPLCRWPVAAITVEQVSAARRAIERESPAQARRALALWRKVFDWSRANGIRTTDNPAIWDGLHALLTPEQSNAGDKHHAAMPYSQVPEFVRDLRTNQARSQGAAALEFCLLTAARSGEVLKMQWEEVDWSSATWTQPAERTKQKRDHRVPLCHRAKVLLTRQRDFGAERPGAEYVFAGRRPNEAMNPARLLHTLRELGHGEVTVHGFRATFRTWADEETDFEWEVKEGCLAHLVGNKTSRSYARGDLLEKRRELMAKWAEFCASASDRPATVRLDTTAVVA